MSRRTRSEWEKIVTEFERGGESHDVLSERRRLNVGSFRGWLYRLRRDAKSGTFARRATEVVRMLPVHVRETFAEPAQLEIAVATIRVRVPIGADVTYVAEPTAPLPGATPEGVHIDNLAALYAWYAEWSEIAHAVIARRADLIKLGIAKPRKRRASPMPIPVQTGTEPSTGTGFGAAPVVAVTTPAPVTNGMSNASNGALATPNASPSVSVA